jgi:hypothetical protein
MTSSDVGSCGAGSEGRGVEGDGAFHELLPPQTASQPCQRCRRQCSRLAAAARSPHPLPHTVRRGPALVDRLSAAHVASAAARTASSPGAGAPPPLVAAGPSRTTECTYSLISPVKSWGGAGEWGYDHEVEAS